MNRRALILTLMMTLPALPAAAGTLACNGTIAQVMTTASSDLRVVPSWRNDWVTLCNVVSPWKGVPVDACKRWHAQALAAQIAQTNTQTAYASTAATACAQMAVASAADAPDTFSNN